MTINFTRKDNIDFQVRSIRLDAANDQFIVNNQLATDDNLYFPFPLKESRSFKVKPRDFQIYLFNKVNYACNDVFEIFVPDNSPSEANKRRLGWLFPIQAIVSDEHDYVENEHFYPYARNAYIKLLNGDYDIAYNSQFASSSDINLETIYGKNTHVLLLYNKYLNIYKTIYGTIFNIQSFLPSFFLYGYNLITSTTFPLFYNSSEAQRPIKNIENHNILILPISTDLKDLTFIYYLFENALPSCNNSLFRFHLIYQVFELLISEVFKLEITNIVEKLKTPRAVYSAAFGT